LGSGGSEKVAEQGEGAVATVKDDDLVHEGTDERPMRADARRNYERLVTAARTVFNEQGGSASMEAIAKEAGVGVGTLYRHFPKRIDVVEAVYRTDVDQLVRTAGSASADLEPWSALVAFLDAFVKYAQGKRTFLNELHEAFEKNPELRSSARDRITKAMTDVLSRAQQAGLVRTDIDGPDLMQLMGSMCVNATLSEDQAERLLGMVLDGLRLAGAQDGG
jgi:AcrR family transcriptional regulator